jgi:hypothetical protein
MMNLWCNSYFVSTLPSQRLLMTDQSTRSISPYPPRHRIGSLRQDGDCHTLTDQVLADPHLLQTIYEGLARPSAEAIRSRIYR